MSSLDSKIILLGLIPVQSPKSWSQKGKEEFGLWASHYNLIGHLPHPTPPTHPQLLSMMEASSNKTHRVKVTQYDTLYQLSTKKQVDSKRENMDESNMFKENIIKEMF